MAEIASFTEGVVCGSAIVNMMEKVSVFGGMGSHNLSCSICITFFSPHPYI